MVFGNEGDGIVVGKVGSAGLSLEVFPWVCKTHHFLFLGERRGSACGRMCLVREAVAAGFHILNLLLKSI